MSAVLWVVMPYVAATVFIVGHVWRWRTDQFGWTTRTSQLMEGRVLRLASPLFHLGVFMAIGGHVLGLLIPASWTAAIGISEGVYHAVSVTAGTIAGTMVVAGLVLLLARRFANPRIRLATTAMDKALFAVMTLTIALGMAETVGVNLLGGGYNYRDTVSVWFRDIYLLHPDGQLMVRPAGLPTARSARAGVHRDVAVHPAGPRLVGAGRLPVAPLHRVPPSPGRHAGPGPGGTKVGGTRAGGTESPCLTPACR